MVGISEFALLNYHAFVRYFENCERLVFNVKKNVIRLIMQKIILGMFVMAILSSCASKPVDVPHYLNEATIYPLALQGNLKPVLTEFMQTPDYWLTPEQLILKQNYIKRFVDLPVFNGTNISGFAGKVLELHEEYWRKALRHDISTEEGYHFWFERLSLISLEAGEKLGPFSDQEGEKLVNFISKKIKAEGYFSQLGRTKPYMDLLLWKKQTLEHYPINLGDTVIDVPVVMMDDFLVFGWLGYATFDHKRTGGWADHEKLYCVKPAYDLTSENFKVSYLSHEGRHFSDYKKFPKLESVDLEYRAKLTELSLAVSTMKELLKKFANEGSVNSGSAHAFASFHVIQNLTKKMNLSIEEVQNRDVVQIQKVASLLLTDHTIQIEKLGASLTKGIFSAP